MRFFSNEDNKNLYESNLPETLKNYIANFNEIIICYIKEKFKDKENLEEILNKIKESYRITEYQIDENIDANACFSYDVSTKERRFKINDKTLNMYSVEEGLIAIYFHEFLHFISYTLDAKIGSRMEEGIADLFSDELTEYFNKMFSKGKIIDYKASTYKKSAIIVKNACVINNDSNELIWNYCTNKDKTKKFFEKAYGKETAELIFQIEEYTNNNQYISKKEKESIEKALEKIDVLNSREIYNYINPVLQKKIYEHAQKKKLTLEDLKKDYPNLSEDFYKNYEIMFSNINKEKERILDSKELNQEEIDNLIKQFFDYININKFKDPNIKNGVYNDLAIDFPLELSNYNSIFELNFATIIPSLYAYKKTYNNEEYNEKEMEMLLEETGHEDFIAKKDFEKKISISKEVYKRFKNKSKDECFEDIKEIVKSNIKELIIINYYEKKLENKEISANDYINKMHDFYKNRNKNSIHMPLKYISSLIKTLVKNENIELNITNFEKTKSKIEEIISDLNISYIPDINAQILCAWDIDKLSIYDVTEIISKYGIDSTVDEKMFEDIRVKGLTEIDKETDIKKILKYINNTTTDKFSESKAFYRCKRGHIYDINEVIKKINDRVFYIIEKASKGNNEYINNKILNYDTGLIRLYGYKWIDEQKPEDIKIMQNITGKSEEKFSSLIGWNFEKELYEKLREYPYLSLIYIAKYYPDELKTEGNIKTNLEKYRTYENDYLKQEYKKAFIDCVNYFINDYNLTEQDIRYMNNTEISILKNLPTEILDEKTEKNLTQKLFQILNEKIKKVFIENHETITDKTTHKKNTEYDLESAIKNTKSEEIRAGLIKIYDNLKKIEIKDENKKTK